MASVVFVRTFGVVFSYISMNCLSLTGWDISSLNLADSMKRAQVLDFGLQQQLAPHMELMKPRPSVYYPDFIAANQSDRADNVIGGNSKWEHLEHLRADIRDFKTSKQLDTVSSSYQLNNLFCFLASWCQTQCQKH